MGGNAFTKEKNIRGDIYLIRDPRDVCISWSKHMGITIDESINFMTNDFASLQWNDFSEQQNFFEGIVQKLLLDLIYEEYAFFDLRKIAVCFLIQYSF